MTGALGQAALIAECSMLRQHVRRDAERKRLAAESAAARRAERRTEPPLHKRFWDAGHEQAMREVLDVADSACKRAGDADHALAFAMKDVVDFAAGVIRLRRVDYFRPEDWTPGGES